MWFFLGGPVTKTCERVLSIVILKVLSSWAFTFESRSAEPVAWLSLKKPGFSLNTIYNDLQFSYFWLLALSVFLWYDVDTIAGLRLNESACLAQFVALVSIPNIFFWRSLVLSVRLTSYWSFIPPLVCSLTSCFGLGKRQAALQQSFCVYFRSRSMSKLVLLYMRKMVVSQASWCGLLAWWSLHLRTVRQLFLRKITHLAVIESSAFECNLFTTVNGEFMTAWCLLFSQSGIPVDDRSDFITCFL